MTSLYWFTNVKDKLHKKINLCGCQEQLIRLLIYKKPKSRALAIRDYFGDFLWMMHELFCVYLAFHMRIGRHQRHGKLHPTDRWFSELLREEASAFWLSKHMHHQKQSGRLVLVMPGNFWHKLDLSELIAIQNSKINHLIWSSHSQNPQADL